MLMRVGCVLQILLSLRGVGRVRLRVRCRLFRRIDAEPLGNKPVLGCGANALGLLARLGKADRGIASQAARDTKAVDRDAQDPAPRAGWIDGQLEAVAVHVRA